MNKYLAWFITFNFINITWIFFRAKNWEGARKILDVMTGIHYVPIMHIHKVKQLFPSIGMSSYTLPFLIAAFIITLTFHNTSSLNNKFYPNKYKLIMGIVLFIYAILNLSNVTEFLYFNF
jgi:capsid portal protein